MLSSSDHATNRHVILRLGIDQKNVTNGAVLVNATLGKYIFEVGVTVRVKLGSRVPKP
jgi:hypothetical protein